MIDKEIQLYSPNILEREIDEEGFARLASAVGALELQVGDDSQTLTLAEARESLIEAQHDEEAIDRAIAMGAYLSPSDNYQDYNQNRKNIHAYLKGWFSNALKKIPRFNFGYTEHLEGNPIETNITFHSNKIGTVDCSFWTDSPSHPSNTFYRLYAIKKGFLKRTALEIYCSEILESNRINLGKFLQELNTERRMVVLRHILSVPGKIEEELKRRNIELESLF